MYTITHPARPSIVLELVPNLADVAATLAALPNADALEVGFNQDGFTRPLNDEERASLGALRKESAV